MSVLSLSEGNYLESFENGLVDANISQNVNTSDSPDGEVEYIANKLNPIIYCSIMAVITTVGVIGNILILVIFCDKENKKSTYSVYFRALAISDSLVLITTLVDDILTRLVDQNILYGNRNICSAYIFWSLFWVQFSAGLLILVALDRYIAVAYPLKRAFLCSYKRSIYITLAAALSCVVLLLHEVIWNEVETKYHTNDVNWIYSCPAVNSNEYGLSTAVYDLLFNALIPFCAIIAFNLRVLYLFKASLGVNQAKRSVSLVRVTMPIISVTVSWALLILPIIVVMFVEMTLRWIDISQEIEENIEKVWSTANVIWLLHYATNFYVLVPFTKRYRSSLNNACCCSKVGSDQVNRTILATQSSSVTHP